MTRSTGHPLHSPLPGGNLTVVFTDIVNSTKLKGLMPGDTSRRRDASYRTTIKEPHDRRVLGLVEQAGGVRVASTGDGFFVTFEDADEAVLCALAIQRALHARADRDAAWAAGGPHRHSHRSSECAGRQSRRADYASTTVDKAQRVQTAAGPGEVFVSSQTHSLVNVRSVTFEEQPPAELKGLGPTTLYRAVAGDIQQPVQTAHSVVGVRQPLRLHRDGQARDIQGAHARSRRADAVGGRRHAHRHLWSAADGQDVVDRTGARHRTAAPSGRPQQDTARDHRHAAARRRRSDLPRFCRRDLRISDHSAGGARPRP